MSMEETTHFFQIVSAQVLLLGKLQIPTKFVRKYGKLCLPGSDVLLVVRNGDTWSVGVDKTDHNPSVVFLGRGWKDLMKHYSLSIGSLVMFRHERQLKSVFSIVIFDISSTEIDYPPHKPPVFFVETSDMETNSLDPDTTSEVEEEDDVFFAKTGVCGSSSNPILIEHDDSDTHFQNLSSKLSKPNANVHRKKTQTHRSKRISKDSAGGGGTGGASRNPSFRLRIRRSYLQPKSRVTIPHKFVSANDLIEDAPFNVWVGLLGSVKTWSMQLLYRDCERRGEFSNAGWHTFWKEVGLAVGDTCEFELTKKVKGEVFFTMSIIA